jgi:tetratricopeptide (TPR) repeat protein
LQAALESMSRVLGPDDVLVGSQLQSLGELERLEGRLGEARSLLERSYGIFDRSKRLDDSRLVDALTSLGLVDEAQGRFDDSARHLSRARELYAQAPGLASRNPSTDYARVLRKAGRIAEAEKIEDSLKPAGTK